MTQLTGEKIQTESNISTHLAIDRTILANERTLLVYGRTALALV